MGFSTQNTRMVHINIENGVSKLKSLSVCQQPAEYHYWWTICPHGHMKPNLTID